jgi:hypothetical protein
MIFNSVKGLTFPTTELRYPIFLKYDNIHITYNVLEIIWPIIIF